MNYVLDQLSPHNVFHYFEILSSIPRGSGNERACSGYILQFAAERGLRASRDAFNNVTIWKPASKGCEHAPTVLLENHMDMVCEKFPEVEHDFTKDGLNLLIDGDFIRADGTSLGADNGIGLAAALAILDDNTLIHPDLEVVCTVGEEIGLIGAQKIDTSGLKAKYMINSDSFRLHMVQAGCAGCVYSVAELLPEWETASNSSGLMLTVGGLIGGHSGLDTCRQRTNANILMGRILDELRSRGISYRIFNYLCENKDNSIARDASCCISLSPSDTEKVTDAVQAFMLLVRKELSITDPDVFCNVTALTAPGNVLSAACTNKMVDYLVLVPNGMFEKSFDFDDPDLAESSSNLGRIVFTHDRISFRSMIRANYESRKNEVRRKLTILARNLGMERHDEADSPGWEFNSDSKLLDILKESYREIYHKEIAVAISHGTCECGHFHAKMDCETLSIGPDIYNLHSPLEKVDIASVGGLYEIMIRMLEKLSRLT